MHVNQRHDATGDTPHWQNSAEDDEARCPNNRNVSKDLKEAMKTNLTAGRGRSMSSVFWQTLMGLIHCMTSCRSGLVRRNLDRRARSTAEVSSPSPRQRRCGFSGARASAVQATVVQRPKATNEPERAVRAIFFLAGRRSYLGNIPLSVYLERLSNSSFRRRVVRRSVFFHLRIPANIHLLAGRRRRWTGNGAARTVHKTMTSARSARQTTAFPPRHQRGLRIGKRRTHDTSVVLMPKIVQ